MILTPYETKLIKNRQSQLIELDNMYYRYRLQGKLKEARETLNKSKQLRGYN